MRERGQLRGKDGGHGTRASSAGTPFSAPPQDAHRPVGPHSATASAEGRWRSGADARDVVAERCRGELALSRMRPMRNTISRSNPWLATATARCRSLDAIHTIMPPASTRLAAPSKAPESAPTERVDRSSQISPDFMQRLDRHLRLTRFPRVRPGDGFDGLQFGGFRSSGSAS